MGVRRSVRGAVGALLFTLAAVLVAPEIDASRSLTSGAANASNASAPSYLETRIGASEIEGRDLVGALGALSAEERSGYAASSGGAAADEHLRVLVHNGGSGLVKALAKAERGAEKAAKGAARAVRLAKVAWRYGGATARKVLRRRVAGILQRTGSLSEAKRFVKSAREGAHQKALQGLLQEAPTHLEKGGLEYGIERLHKVGYDLIDANLAYRGRQGLDAVLRHRVTGRFAVLEAKHGRSLSLLKTDVVGLRQGERGYVISRLNRYLAFGDGKHDDLVRRLLSEIPHRRVDSVASLKRSGRVFELPNGWPTIAKPIRH